VFVAFLQVQYTADGEIIYAVGAVVVSYSPNTHRQRFFLSHTDDVISLAVSPDGHHVATGQLGRNPRVYIYDTTTLTTVSLLRGRFKKGICQLAFSGDGSLLACVGLDDEATLIIYRWQEEVVVSMGKVGKAKVLSLAFSLDGSVVAVGSAAGMTFHWLTGGQRYLRRRKGVMGKRCKIQPALSCCYLSTGQCISGMVDGSLYFWDEAICKGSIQAHNGPVYSLVAVGPTLVTGGGEGVVKLWEEGMKSSEVGKLPAAVKSISASSGRSLVIATHTGQIYEVSSLGSLPKLLLDSHEKGQVHTVATHPKTLEFVTGGEDRALCVWDGHERKLMHKVVMEAPITAASYSPDGSLIAIGYGSAGKAGETESESSGMVLVLNANTLEVVCKDTRAAGTIRVLQFSRDGNLLAAGSNDRSIYLYEVTAGFKRVYSYRCTCKGHGGAVLHLDFSGDGRHLQSNSSNYELLYWLTSSGKQLPHGAIELKDEKWATRTCPLGWSVQGLWPEVQDEIVVTSCERSSGGSLLASTDDFGRVRLMTYPSNKLGSQAMVSKGHSPSITTCRWTVDDILLITCGGQDRGVFQWVLADDDDSSNNGSGGTPPPSVESGGGGSSTSMPQQSPVAPITVNLGAGSPTKVPRE